MLHTGQYRSIKLKYYRINLPKVLSLREVQIQEKSLNYNLLIPQCFDRVGAGGLKRPVADRDKRNAQRRHAG